MLHLIVRHRLVCLLLASLGAPPALAVLGEPVGLTPVATPSGAPVFRSAALRPSLSGRAMTVRETLQDDGIAVQEYVNSAGIVFAVAWSGPGFPDLRTLLGTYFDSYKASTELPGQRRTLGGSVQFERAGLVVRTVGRMRSFVGVALVSDLIPPGVAIGDLLP